MQAKFRRKGLNFSMQHRPDDYDESILKAGILACPYCYRPYRYYYEVEAPTGTLMCDHCYQEFDYEVKTFTRFSTWRKDGRQWA